MSKKIGKFLLAAAGLATAAAAAYYYLQKKDTASCLNHEEEEDLDNFSEDLDDAASRNYVPLTREESAANDAPQTEAAAPESQAAAPAPESQAAQTEVEEFFDEEDPEGTEPPIAE